MEKTARAFVIGIRERDGEVYLDCIADYCGRTELRLRKEPQAQLKQREQLQPCTFVTLCLFAPPLSTHIVIRVENTVETFPHCRSERGRMQCAKAVYELADRLTCGCAVPESLPLVLRAMQAAEYADTDPRIILIRLVYHLMRIAGHCFSFQHCGVCGHGFISHSKFYFNPIAYRMECFCCISGDSTFLEKSTFYALKSMVLSEPEAVSGLKASESTLNLLLYQFYEAAVEKFGSLPELERAIIDTRGHGKPATKK